MAVYPIFPGEKRKTFTVSYDDGWPQDEKLISMMNDNGDFMNKRVTLEIKPGEELYLD